MILNEINNFVKKINHIQSETENYNSRMMCYYFETNRVVEKPLPKRRIVV